MTKTMLENVKVSENAMTPTTPINEIILYQPDNSHRANVFAFYVPAVAAAILRLAVKLEVRLENETVRLTQAQMVELFQTSKQNVSLHINNIFKEGELERLAVVNKSLNTAADLIKSAKKSITLIDNYVDGSVLTLYQNEIAEFLISKGEPQC